MLLVGAGLLAKHVVALPAPNNESHLAQSLGELRRAGSSGWLAVHVLYAECRCSQRIVAHLTSTERPRRWQEVVLWVGDADPDPGLYRAFDVRRLSHEQLGRFGVESAPLLVALDPEGRAVYVGGYTDRKQGPDIRDLYVLAEAEQRNALSALPVFGCAVSERLKRALAALPAP
ncbi:MAG: hypothetical protein K0R38_3012 [Polyangiaceae bacterium]|jgi:hypothetical protein|nr:hypothetical protein [Polyangiaceae bacterium]